MTNYGAHDNIAIIHAVFGSLLALVIVPSGILIARYRLTPPPEATPKSCCAKKSVVPRPRTWLHLHILCNVLGIVGVLIVFSLGVASVLTAGEGVQFTGDDADIHHCLGLALTILMIAQGALGWWAHRKPSGNKAVEGIDAQTTLVQEGVDAEKGALVQEDAKPEAPYRLNDELNEIEVLNNLPIDEEDPNDNLNSGQGRGCCSGSDPNVPGGCACAMSNLNGAPCCCGGKGDRDDLVAKESPRGGRGGIVRKRSDTGVVTRMLGAVVKQRNGDEEEEEKAKKGAKKHSSRWFHSGLGLVIAAGLYWESWNGLNLEYASMSISLTTVPQSVQIIFWLLFLLPVAAYIYSIGDGMLKGLGRMTIGMEERDRARREAWMERRKLRVLKVVGEREGLLEKGDGR